MDYHRPIPLACAKMFRKSMQSEDEKLARKSANAASTAKSRSMESKAERAARNSANAALTAMKRGMESEMEKKSRNLANSVAAVKKRKLETEVEARTRKNIEKQQKAVHRANTIPDSQFSARNAHKIFFGKQIVQELNESPDKLGDMDSKCKFCSAKKNGRKRLPHCVATQGK